VKQPRHLLGAPRKDVPQDQHRTLPRRQRLQRRNECQPNRLALRDQRGRIPINRKHPAVRNRLQPGTRRQRGAEVWPTLRRRAQIHCPGTPLRTAQHVQADIGRNRIKPGPHRSTRRVVPIGVAPCPHKRLLHRILGLERRPQHPIAVTDQLCTQRLEIHHLHSSL
jgi:hypothetical protein